MSSNLIQISRTVRRSQRKDISNLGCSNEQLNAAAYQVYINLCEDKKLYDISYHYSKDLNLVYITASHHQGGPNDFYVPMPSFQNFDFEQIQKYQTLLNKNSGDNDKARPNSIVMAICDSSATILYYKMTQTFPDFDQAATEQRINSEDMKMDFEDMASTSTKS